MNAMNVVTPAERLLNQITYAPRYDDLCEALGGFRNDAWHQVCWRSGEHRFQPGDVLLDGEPIDALDATVIRLAYFDLDYISILYAQVWDHTAENPTWEHVVFLNWARNDWVPEVLWGFGATRPFYAEVGAIVDDWLVSVLLPSSKQ
jgi:hypothetical protein